MTISEKLRRESPFNRGAEHFHHVKRNGRSGRNMLRGEHEIPAVMGRLMGAPRPAQRVPLRPPLAKCSESTQTVTRARN